ncbi:Lin0368 family putative glycerol transporter subunit [Alkaliphilus crotonatoxidans]
MKHVGTIIGSAIAGMFVMSVWGAFVDQAGIIGGWFAGLIIIGTMWLMNHYIGVINNDGAFVDMACGIGVAGLMRDVFSQGIQVGIDSLPTLVLVILGGALGGLAAFKVEQYIAERDKQAAKETA